METLNEVFSKLSMRRRYEVWFLRLGLADGAGAWWFRYLLTNPGRPGCQAITRGAPVQVWATWFPIGRKPQTFIQEFPLSALQLGGRHKTPFEFRVHDNAIDDHGCRGDLQVEGHAISWDLRFRSTFRVTLSNKGWIGFSRTPHSDAQFSGQITFDGRKFSGDPLGFGVQGHNCGYRHRNFWTWAHAYFPRADQASTLEALVYEMPLGLVFRKAVLWHRAVPHIFRDLRESGSVHKDMRWNFSCRARDGFKIEVAIDGSGPGIHRLPYVKTDCSGTFEVRNNSLASASVAITAPSGETEKLETPTGAVLELVG